MDTQSGEFGRRRPARPLPTFYYHSHFLEMLDFVSGHYQHVLRAAHRQFIDEFQRLDKPAQCLYVRLVNRKGRVFSRSRLRYAEIGDTAAALDRLRGSGWIGPPAPEHFTDLLGFLTRAELLTALARDFTGISRSLRKADYVGFARRHCDPAAFVASLRTDRVFVQRRFDTVRYLLFLYFGRLPDGLSQFTMRDLGLVRTQSFRDEFEPRFDDREQAEEHYYFSVRLKQLDGAGTLADLPVMIDEADHWPVTVSPGGARLRDRLAYQLGRAAERAALPEKALQAYGRGESPKCCERVVRLLLAQKRSEEARQLLERCLETPSCGEEWLFAKDLYERKFGRKRTTPGTDELREAETIELDEVFAGNPERGAVEYFSRQGNEAYRVENTLWRTLFGLLFWEELFGARSTDLHSPFDWLPPSLSDGSFYARHETAIEARLSMLRHHGALTQHLLQASTRHYGQPNGVFRWRRKTLDALFAMLRHLPPERLAAPIRRLCRQYNDVRHGYPDLLVIDDRGVRFVEIKAEGDQLRKNQLLRLEQLRAAGLRADIVRVRWTLDPEQTYVVVDVETTGGKGDRHRVTEIGAVKMQGGRIVDRFQTLINPQRPIPSGITRLTGISQEMVSDAPIFADVIDSFEAFFGDAIFVAHNVGFDYRFITQEFERLGRGFRHPKLCTCASMRKLYPGYRSYSLAALCRQFDIPLRQHHRALCDAEAAAELLVLINERRQALIDERPPTETSLRPAMV